MLQVLGTAGLGLNGWTVASDGQITQDSVSAAGEVFLPLHVEESRPIAAIWAWLSRAASGAAAAVAPTLKFQQRSHTDSAGPGAWADVPGVTASIVQATSSRAVQIRLTLRNSAFAPARGYSYRLRLTGESGANAQALTLLDVGAL